MLLDQFDLIHKLSLLFFFFFYSLYGFYRYPNQPFVDDLQSLVFGFDFHLSYF